MLVCASGDVKRNNILEIDSDNKLVRIQDLTLLQTETAHTVFYNGIISPSIISLAKRLSSDELNQVSKNYLYINLLTDYELPTLNPNKNQLIIDANSEDPKAFSSALQANFEKLNHLSIFEIINAATYHPASVLGIDIEIMVHSNIKPVLWQHANLITKSLTATTELISL